MSHTATIKYHRWMKGPTGCRPRAPAPKPQCEVTVNSDQKLQRDAKLRQKQIKESQNTKWKEGLVVHTSLRCQAIRLSCRKRKEVMNAKRRVFTSSLYGH